MPLMTDTRKQPRLGPRKRPPARPLAGLGYAGSNPAAFGGGRTAFEQKHIEGRVPTQSTTMTDAQLLRPGGAAAGQAYDRRQAFGAPGGAGAAGAGAGAALLASARRATPRPFAVTEPTQVGYEQAQRGYGAGQALLGGVTYTGHQVGGAGAGMGAILGEYKGPKPAGGGVPSMGDVPGAISMRLSGSYPQGTPEAQQELERNLGGQRDAYLRGGTGAVEAYKAAKEAGADDATARDAATMVQIQQRAGGAPLTRGEIVRGQAETAAATEQARAVEQIARDMPEAMKQQQKNDFITRMAELGRTYLDGGDIDSWRRVMAVTEKLATGQEPPQGWWEWIAETMGIGVVEIFRQIFKRGTPSGGAPAAGGGGGS